VDVRLEGEDIRKQVDVKQEKERTISCPVYYDGDSVGGTVCLFVLDRLTSSSHALGLSMLAAGTVITDSYTSSGR